MPREPQPQPQPQPDATAKKHAPAGLHSGSVVPVFTSVTDVIVPGLGVSIGAVLLLIRELCRRLLKRKHERLTQVSKRLSDLFEHAKAMEKKGKFAPPEWLGNYRDLVARFQAFLAACEERHALLRLVSGGKENRRVREFEEEIYGLYRSMDFQACAVGRCCIQ